MSNKKNANQYATSGGHNGQHSKMQLTIKQKFHNLLVLLQFYYKLAFILWRTRVKRFFECDTWLKTPLYFINSVNRHVKRDYLNKKDEWMSKQERERERERIRLMAEVFLAFFSIELCVCVFVCVTMISKIKVTKRTREKISLFHRAGQ